MSRAPAIGVLGAGAWGTALAAMLAADGTPVLIWAHEAAVADDINTTNHNRAFLPGVPLPEGVRATSALADLAGLPAILAAVPAQHLGPVLGALTATPQDLVVCAKGIAADAAQGGLLMSDVARGHCPAAECAVLSGPTFAHEVALGLPTAVTLACGGGPAQWGRLAPLLSRPAFRPYYSDDVVGAQIGGAVKNVLAIACGIVAGLGLGENARAALIARGFAEMTRFAIARSAQAHTLAGLAGLGDLVLTCSSPASRNFALGRALGEGLSAAEALAGKRSVAEGATTAPVLVRLAREWQVEMPIVAGVVAILEGASPREVVAALLTRPLTAEHAAR